MDHIVTTDTNGLLSGLNKTQNTNIPKQTSIDPETNGYNESNPNLRTCKLPSPSPQRSGKFDMKSMNSSIFSLVSEKHCM